MSDGITRIATERMKQAKKWGTGHDMECHPDGSLADAAAYLAAFSTRVTSELGSHIANKHPGDRIAHLTIAGALCAAEIDRLESSK